MTESYPLSCVKTESLSVLAAYMSDHIPTYYCLVWYERYICQIEYGDPV
jgi:hypothetical protein